MKGINHIIIVFTLLLISSCDEDKKASKKQQSYDIEILYRQTAKTMIRPNKHFNDKYLNDGKLYLHFESFFKNDTMTVNVNGKFHAKLILNTDSGLGYADFLEFERIEEVNSISLSLNNGNEAFFEIGKINHIAINYWDSTLTIRYLENVPYYE